MKRVILSLVAGSVAAAGAWAAGRPPDDRPAWPQANGPFGNFNPRKYGVKLLDDISQAKLVWTSEENDLGYGKRSGDDSLYRWLGHPGAANSSLAAEGNLFVSSYRPAGDVWSKGNPYDGWFDKIPAEHQERFRSNFRIEADDFTVAIDMASGKTVWKTVEECKGMNRHMPKRGGWCVSPAYHDGRVFSMGTTGRLYGYEAATGKKLWESDIGKGHQTWEAQKAKIIEEARNDRPARLAKDRCQVSLIGADGVLIVPLYDGPDMGLGGVDGRTGKVMWQVPAATARTATPALWCHEGRQYVLAATCGDANRRTAKLRLIDPRTGKVLWTVDGLCNTHFSLAPSDKHVLVNVGSKTPGHGGIPWMLLGCYRLSLDGAKLVWTMPDELEFWHEGTYESSDWRKYLIHDGKVYYYSRARNPDQSMVFGFFIFDEQTGRILYRKRAPQGGDDAPVPGQHYFIEDRLLQVPDASHGDRLTLRLWTTDPKDLRPLCPPWNPPHIATTAYEVFMEFPYVDGRIFMRTRDGRVVCYDLRASAAGPVPSKPDASGPPKAGQGVLPEPLGEYARYRMVLKQGAEDAHDVVLEFHARDDRLKSGWATVGPAAAFLNSHGLERERGRVAGSVKVAIQPDRFFLSGGRAIECAYQLDAEVGDDGRLAGTFSGEYGRRHNKRGDLTGTILSAGQLWREFDGDD